LLGSKQDLAVEPGRKELRKGSIVAAQANVILIDMKRSFSGVEGPGPPSPGFVTTHWSVVLAAKDRHRPEGRKALEELCSSYWYPLYAYARRKGLKPDDAADATQGFFAAFLEKDWLAQVNQAKGRFRDFLRVALDHYLANQRARARAKKRGGGCKLVSFDIQDAETRYRLEPADPLTPDQIYERQWALAVLSQVMAELETQYQRIGKQGLFDSLKCFLLGPSKDLPYARLASRLGMTEAAVRVAVHRLRQRYRRILREKIALTVDSPDQVETEIRYLIGLLSG